MKECKMTKEKKFSSQYNLMPLLLYAKLVSAEGRMATIISFVLYVNTEEYLSQDLELFHSVQG